MPKTSRRALAILLIAIAGAAAAISFVWWYNQRASEEEFKHYSNYGVSFEYPKDMEISEEGSTVDSGVLIGELGSNEELEFIRVEWQTQEINPSLETILNASFLNLESEGFILQKGQKINFTTTNGYEMLYQSFTGTDAEAIPLKGISGVWYCSTSNRSFEFILLLVQSEQDTNSKFLQYTNSFACT
jgi:hypothetical protein